MAGFSHPRARVIAASEVVGMDDPIEVALRKKKDSSMRVAIQQVKDGAAQAAVSAGNTGALMAIARYLLKTLDGIDRPAIAPQLPNSKGGATTVLDLGANVDCDAEDLLQFAVLGSALVSALTGNESPSVGLLNVGEEAIKGSETIKKASQLLRKAASSEDLNFYGNVEGNDIFKGTTDIVVCDGFVGNVTLKATEGRGIDDRRFPSHRVFEQHFQQICRDRVLSGPKGAQTPTGSSAVQRRRLAGAARTGVQEPRFC